MADQDRSQFPPNPPHSKLSDAEWHALCIADVAHGARSRKEADERAAAQQRRERYAGQFRTDHEDGCGVGGDEKPAAALMFNPKADPLAIAVAALARADSLRRSLMAWSCTGSGMLEVSEVAQALEPTGQEIVLLLDELITRLNRAAQAQALSAANG